ncbi:MAG: hypothetical protein V3S24_06325, partial [Candidatus Tectomicrobia bacterium]
MSLFLISGFMSVLPTTAISKTLMQAYTYHASDIDSQISARVIARHTVARRLISELATTLERPTDD